MLRLIETHLEESEEEFKLLSKTYEK